MDRRFDDGRIRAEPPPGEDPAAVQLAAAVMNDAAVRRMLAAQLVLAAPPNPVSLGFTHLRSCVAMLADGQLLSDRTRREVMADLDEIASRFDE